MRYFIGFIFLVCATHTFASSNKVSITLDELDRKLGERYIYAVEKERKINALKFDLSNSAESPESAKKCHALFEEYKTYQYDSAYLYARRVREYALEIGNKDDEAQSLSDLLYCYSTAGFFKEGAEIIASFSTQDVSRPIVANFYREAIRYYFNLMRYVGGTEELNSRYRQEMLHSTKQALEYYEPDSFNYRFIDVQSDVLLRIDNSESIEKIEELLSVPNLSLNNKAIMYSWLGMAYGLRGDSSQAIYYTALSAIADIESCTFETTSAKNLSEYMYQKGDIERAAKYIQLALLDANTYNSPYRKLEIQSILPEIAEERLYIMQKDTRFLAIISLVIIFLLLLIASMLLKIHHRNRALRAARAEIEEHVTELGDMNEQLSLLNSSLSEANEIKDRYIIESLYSDSDFVDNVEKICKVLIRKIKAKQYAELLDLISGISIKGERQRMSSTFDSAFLKLFPNFLDEYNKLFEPSAAIKLGENGELSPEVRIFALIRLGIDDVNLISKYLNLSQNTVYVYKAKVKARTTIPKDEFEEYIKAIKQPY